MHAKPNCDWLAFNSVFGWSWGATNLIRRLLGTIDRINFDQCFEMTIFERKFNNSNIQRGFLTVANVSKIEFPNIFSFFIWMKCSTFPIKFHWRNSTGGDARILFPSFWRLLFKLLQYLQATYIYTWHFRRDNNKSFKNFYSNNCLSLSLFLKFWSLT